jgi:hypothetical protein
MMSFVQQVARNRLRLGNRPAQAAAGAVLLGCGLLGSMTIRHHSKRERSQAPALIHAGASSFLAEGSSERGFGNAVTVPSARHGLHLLRNHIRAA